MSERMPDVVSSRMVMEEYGIVPVSSSVNHPAHYTGHPSGVECITVTEHMGFCLGNAVKYIWRADLKGDALEDLRKARWYVDREIARRELLASQHGRGRSAPAGAGLDE